MAHGDPARAAALLLLDRWEENPVPVDELLAELDASLSDGRDQRFARQLVLGTLRWRLRLDWIIGHFCRRPVDELEARVLTILRLGILQVGFMDRVPERAAVHTSVELAKRHGARSASGLINAILRAFIRQPKRVRYPDPNGETARHLSLYHSHPQWLVERWLERLGREKTLRLVEANNLPAPVWLRPNPLRSTSAALCGELELEQGPGGYLRALEPRAVFRSPTYADGHFQIQDPSAGMAVDLLDPQPGERVLDACSAPGGKATQIAEKMDDCGVVVAADRSLQRLQRLRENTQRLHLHCIRPMTWDACTVGSPHFDRILVDAPCSGTGILGRHPDARWTKGIDQLPALVARQSKMLAAAFTHLRPGGVLVYSTCSLEREENEDVVEALLNETPTARIEEAREYLRNDERAARYAQALPGQHPGDGAFAARIRKVTT